MALSNRTISPGRSTVISAYVNGEAPMRKGARTFLPNFIRVTRTGSAMTVSVCGSIVKRDGTLSEARGVEAAYKDLTLAPEWVREAVVELSR